jgi:uncharacterized protein (DUF2147 family)
MAPSLLFAALLAQGPESLLAGHWTNASGSVIIMIGPCSDGGLCGTVEWSSEKAAADAARAGTTTLVGTEILHGFVPSGENRWKGQLFVPDLNKKSTAELRLLNGDGLQVRGCAVGRLLCKSQSWIRTEPR